MKNKFLQKVLWFTGLSGSGKTTLSRNLLYYLKKKKFKCYELDGDKFRSKKKYKNSFTKNSIKKNNELIIDKIDKIREDYDFVVVSVISPLKVTRYKAKKIFKEDYIEIFIDCPLTELINRDTKGLYKLAINKKIKNLIGYNSKIKYERTRFKKIVVNTKNKNINFSNNKIIQDLNKKFNVKI